VLHFAFLLSSAAGAVPSSACRSLSATVLMLNSHRLLVICSSQKVCRAEPRCSKRQVLQNKDHATCGKERFIGQDHRAITLVGFRVRLLG
jgi:hypothetical protein